MSPMWQKVSISFNIVQTFRTTQRAKNPSMFILLQIIFRFVDFSLGGFNDTVVIKTNHSRYYVKSENQLLLCENLGWKNDLYLILKP